MTSSDMSGAPPGVAAQEASAANASMSADETPSEFADASRGAEM